MNEYKNPLIQLPTKNDENGKKKEKTSNIGKEYHKIENTYFVFIDMLGFKATFNKNQKNVKEVFEYFNALIEQLTFLKYENCYAGQTSDSLYFYTNNVNYLVCFIRVFLHFNAYAMSKNIFFRGGISKGTLFVSKPYQYYGDCVINSYLLESTISSYPRFSIDEKTMKDTEEFLNREKFDHELKRFFLNPFSPSIMDDISECLNTSDLSIATIDINTIKIIEKNLKKNLKDNEFADKNYKKYLYLLEKCKELLKEITNKS